MTKTINPCDPNGIVLAMYRGGEYESAEAAKAEAALYQCDYQFNYATRVGLWDLMKVIASVDDCVGTGANIQLVRVMDDGTYLPITAESIQA
ncbi:hypothetical protein [Neptuniibacter sp. QD37_11]|uniref:hypothetical protein n=1 Tax=Neptuniibacter sp. QD37_11 TaxID=3398209 RepID=UPI0039F5C178